MSNGRVRCRERRRFRASERCGRGLAPNRGALLTRRAPRRRDVCRAAKNGKARARGPEPPPRSWEVALVAGDAARRELLGQNVGRRDFERVVLRQPLADRLYLGAGIRIALFRDARMIEAAVGAARGPERLVPGDIADD